MPPSAIEQLYTFGISESPINHNTRLHLIHHQALLPLLPSPPVHIISETVMQPSAWPKSTDSPALPRWKSLEEKRSVRHLTPEKPQHDTDSPSRILRQPKHHAPTRAPITTTARPGPQPVERKDSQSRRILKKIKSGFRELFSRKRFGGHQRLDDGNDNEEYVY
ncbi:hypothetical protein N7532_001084 [Penicillium argentinense]|uniref:Uncharacterized protein n=1 Tax=Penicillium argentinense TaxID=1131581 RepID=A0A9W9KKX6_9EURO|nr:uncharacterized protein N7532_001084 [Penicillium argentinense]KAJ5110549.1 hypothetical protein N7532_001084 [Penicillium argentinense]